MSDKKRLLYVQTSGVNTPERLYAPFVLASTAAASGLEATIFFLGMGITGVKAGEAEKIQLGAFPALKRMMDMAVEAGVRLLVCEASCQMLSMSSGDFVQEATIAGAATLNDLVLQADGTMWF